MVAENPTACYVVVGATHPDLIRVEGEAYRKRLEAQVSRLGMEAHVRFVDRFLGRVELTRWLEAADVFVTPYPKLDQIVSGTLSYAMGAGRAIVSTPYTYAAELLADDRGVLVEPDSATALAGASIESSATTSCARASGVGPMPTAARWCGRPSGPDTGRSSSEPPPRSASPVHVGSLAAIECLRPRSIP